MIEIILWGMFGIAALGLLIVIAGVAIAVRDYLEGYR